LWRFRSYQRIKEATAKLESPTIVGEVYDGANNITFYKTPEGVIVKNFK